SQGRILAMVAKATPDQRKPLEELIARKWSEVKASGDMRDYRQFVTMFGSLFRVGREARLELSERLLEGDSPTALLEAEQHLQLLRDQQDDPEIAARALDALARSSMRRGQMEDAAYYYRILGRDFPHVIVRDGKTGEDLLNELATDKRFLPYLDEPGQAWMGHPQIKVEQENVNAQPAAQ